MSSKSFPFCPCWTSFGLNRRRLCVALAVSALLHLMLLGGLNFHLPAFHTPEQTVEVQLAVQSAPKAIPKPAPIPAPKPVVPHRKHESQPLSEPAAHISPEPAAQTQAASTAEPADVAAPAEAAAAEPPAPAPDAAPTASATEADTPLQEADSAEDSGNSYTTDGASYAAAAQALPTYIETDFDIRRSIGGSKVGVTHISYQVQADGSYAINSVSEAKGLLSLFLSDKLVQRSEGRVTESGLQPERFLYQYGDKANKKQIAVFDWQTGQLQLETGKGNKTEPLPAGTQDLLSFMYQFMFVPPLQQMQLSVTNGKGLSTYTYSFEGEEQLETKTGNIDTLHILKKGDDGEEKTELWLAVDYHYIPVKMRKTDEDGSVVEQVATSISTNTLK